MARSTKALLLTYLASALTVLTLDLVTKELAEELFKEPVRALPFLYFYLITNKGVAFGFLAELPDEKRMPLLLIPPLLAVPITLAFALKARSLPEAAALGFIAGGALGNFYDRLLYGEVRDFIHLHWRELHWPAFNLADAFITLGGLYLILDRFVLKRAR
ncbi:MAG: signal peptidase II [Aquificae bacterium]|nr:signal peptidase II [Aquificota bacterium]